jgi:hypothetical protein
MSDELRPEYEFDYRQAKPNRFAAGWKPGGRIVVLEPEVAEVFQTSQDVNALLRAVLQAMALNGVTGPAKLWHDAGWQRVTI